MHLDLRGFSVRFFRGGAQTRVGQGDPRLVAFLSRGQKRGSGSDCGPCAAMWEDDELCPREPKTNLPTQPDLQRVRTIEVIRKMHSPGFVPPYLCVVFRIAGL